MSYSSDLKTDVCLQRLSRIKSGFSKSNYNRLLDFKQGNIRLEERIRKLENKDFKTCSHKVIWIDEYHRLLELESQLESENGILKDSKDSSLSFKELLEKEEELSTEIFKLQVKNSILSMDHWNPWIEFNGEKLKFLDLTCSDKDLTISRQLDYQKMYDRCQTQVYELNLNYSEVLKKENGGFQVEELFKFRKLRQEYSKVSKKEFYERAILEIKGKSKKKLLELEFWIQKLDCYKSRVSSLFWKYKGLINGFIQRTREIYRENQEFLLLDSLKEEEECIRKEKSRLLHERIGIWKREKLYEIRKIENNLSKELQEKLEKEQQEFTKKLKLREKVKKDLEKYHEKLLLDVFKQESIIKNRENQRLLEKELENQYNQTRIEYRHSLLKDREREKSARNALEQDKKRWRDKQLELSKYKVEVEQYIFEK